MTLEQFNSKYRYKLDKDNFGFKEVWTMPKEKEDGLIYGDCEDYCIFLKHNVEQFKTWDYFYCKINGIGHCILVKDNLVIDCNIQRVIKLEEYYKVFSVTDFHKYSKFVIFSKFVLGNILKLFKGR